MDVRGKVTVVTGASRGLGAGMAEEMRRHGVRLGLCARSAPALAEGEDVVAERLDVTDEAGLGAFAERVVTRFGRIDLWINNAGVLEPIAPLRDVKTEDFRRHLDVNVTGVFLGTRAFVRHVRRREGGGVLVNVSSGAASSPYHGWSAYCAGKAAVDLMTQVVALEEADAGLRAHAVAPGVIDTDMQTLIRECPPERFAEVERFREMKRAGSFNTAGFVARELLALAFDPARRTDDVVVRLPPER